MHLPTIVFLFFFGLFIAVASCLCYVHAPVVTLFVILGASLSYSIALSYPWNRKLTMSDIKPICFLNLALFAPAILCIIPLHFACGIGHIHDIDKPVDRVVISSTFSDDNISGSYITYTDRHSGAPERISVEIPSDASLSSGAVAFKPTAIIEYNGLFSGLANWIADQRKIGVEVTQGQKKFSAIINVQDWSEFIEQAYTPEQMSDEIAYENQKKQRADGRLDKSLKAGQPF